MIRILIVEDELIIANDLKDILESMDYEVLGIAKSYDVAKRILESEIPDIVLLDIQIEGSRDGIELAQLIKQKFQIPFVFISSHTDKATLERAKDCQPNGFLVKPFEDDDVRVAVELALSNFSKEQNAGLDEDHAGFVMNDSLFIRQKNLSVKVKYDEIMYASADANYCTLYLSDKKYVLRSTLKELEQKLSDRRFFRSHKSFLINLNNLTAVHSEYLCIGDEELPIGREQQSWLMKQINKI
ncbi:MAG: response regulator [Reichenbachiella sp.]|uniref:LytR/AlgR family response regulator transcription factor n=1 Tax=Reichenbachiella sp. TaxID=2184521 RepID=UPI00329A451D